MNPSRRPPTFLRGCRASLLGALLLAAGCDSAPTSTEEAPASDAAPTHSDRGGIGTQMQALSSFIDPSRSLAVTEQSIVANFPITDVMNQLHAQAGGTGLAPPDVFRQLWDINNPGPGLGWGEHCNDPAKPAPSFNHYPYACRPGEGAEAAGFTLPTYLPIGLFNRFDLMDPGGADCGEYRIIYAKNTGVPGNRNLLIFEAVLPNPRTDLGVEGCRPVAEFWRELTTDPSNASRTAKLRNFYFNGLPGFRPVVHFRHYGFNPGRKGQVRTNQFMQPNWNLREYKLIQDCSAIPCTLRFTPETDKVNPFGGLFNPNLIHPDALPFQNWFDDAAVIAGLAVKNVNTFNYSPPDVFNSGESDAQDPMRNHYVNQFNSAGPPNFRNNINATLAGLGLGGTLNANNMVARAMALSCAGCHQLSNGANLGDGLVWPASLGFTHVSELSVVAGPNGPRFQQSPALLGTFLPHRVGVLQAYLDKTRPLHRWFNGTGGRAYATDPVEKAWFDNPGNGYTIDGIAGFVYLSPPPPTAVQLLRITDSATGDSILTTDPTEPPSWPSYSATPSPGWCFPAPAPGTVPLRRFRELATGGHIYTTTPAQISAMAGDPANFADEGTTCFVHRS
jgi:hypothetical protein